MLIIPALLLLPLAALVAARSAWGRRTLAYTCIGLATGLPHFAAGCAKANENHRSESGSENGSGLHAVSRSLEFRIAVDPQTQGLEGHFAQLDESGPGEDADASMGWFAVNDLERLINDPQQLEYAKQLLADSEQGSDEEPNDSHDALLQLFVNARGVVARPYRNQLYVLLHNQPGLSMTEGSGWLTLGSKVISDELGTSAINFRLDDQGAQKMRVLTEPNIGQPMAVLVNDQIVTVATIHAPLNDSIQISGDFTDQQVSILNQTIRETGSGRSP